MLLEICIPIVWLMLEQLVHEEHIITVTPTASSCGREGAAGASRPGRQGKLGAKDGIRCCCWAGEVPQNPYRKNKAGPQL